MSAELLGIPAEFEHAGTLYRLGPATQKAKAVLEELLAGNAIKNVSALKAVLPPNEYQAAYADIVRQAASGAFKTGTSGWSNSLVTPDGTTAFYLSLFRVNHPNMTMGECYDLLVAAGDDCSAAMSRVAPDFFVLALPNMTPEARATITAAFGGASKDTTPKLNDTMAL